MLGQFEEKGKIYTPVISKEPVEVLIQTASQRIQGMVHIRPNERLKDQIDHPERYLAVTDALISTLDGKPLYSVKFLAINHTQIVWIAPVDEISPAEEIHE